MAKDSALKIVKDLVKIGHKYYKGPNDNPDCWRLDTNRGQFHDGHLIVRARKLLKEKKHRAKRKES